MILEDFFIIQIDMIYTLTSDNEPSVNENFLYNELKKFALQAD